MSEFDEVRAQDLAELGEWVPGENSDAADDVVKATGVAEDGAEIEVGARAAVAACGEEWVNAVTVGLNADVGSVDVDADVSALAATAVDGDGVGGADGVV